MDKSRTHTIFTEDQQKDTTTQEEETEEEKRDEGSCVCEERDRFGFMSEGSSATVYGGLVLVSKLPGLVGLIKAVLLMG